VTRRQFALIGALLGAIAVGVFIIAFEANAALTTGRDIKQHSRGIFMLVGAGAGFLLFGLFGGESRTRSTAPPDEPPDTTP
jgi:multisubunit Na+/H+ antiporter MnhB subunit